MGKEISFPNINKIRNEKNLVERLHKLSPYFNSDQTKHLNKLRQKINNFKISDKNVIVYEGLPSDEELNTCNKNLGCKLTSQQKALILDTYTKNISNQSNISKIKTNDFLQEIKNIPETQELKKLKKFIKPNFINLPNSTLTSSIV